MCHTMTSQNFSRHLSLQMKQRGGINSLSKYELDWNSGTEFFPSLKTEVPRD